MLGQQFSTILAQTDPFDLAQGVERYIRSLRGDQVRFTIVAARQLMSEAYRVEFVQLLEERDDERLKNAFIQAIKRNLRAIPLFGPAFCKGVIDQLPGERTVALGEEARHFLQVRPLALGVIALALVIGGVAAEHVWNVARATAQTPVVLVTPPAVAIQTPPPVATTAPKQNSRTAMPAATPSPSPAPQPTPAPLTPPPPAQAVPARVQTAAPVAAHPRTPPPGRGVKTIVAVTPSPTPEPTDVDVSDMPQSFTDATPLPQNETAPPAQPADMGVTTPTPQPNHSWTHRIVHAGVHLVNSTLTVIGVSKRPTPTPTGSPSGPQPPR